ncbi:MAG: glycoside hydrolase family 2 TIM barrel-domain containing protein [Acidobacteriota bacterium]
MRPECRLFWVSLFSIAAALLGTSACSSTRPLREQRPLTTDWKFLRGDPSGAEQASFDDADWRTVDLPHDWSIEDLPARDQDPLYAVVTLVPGTWRLRFGDDARWKAVDARDASWRQVDTPDTWSAYGSAAGGGVGWYRRSFTIPENAAGKRVLIELGRIRGGDQTFVDGQEVGSTQDGYWSNGPIKSRTYLLPEELSRPGEHVVAVRVAAKTDGGLIAADDLPDGSSPFDPGRSVGGMSTGYAVGGTGWYRRHFTLAPEDAGRAVHIVFDGSYMETTVWLNGVEVGRNVYGYTPFSFDLTPALKPAGQGNVLAVRVTNLGQNSRWYSGSGLYRPVSLVLTSPLHVAIWGIAATTPEVSADMARVRIKVELEIPEATSGRVQVRLIDPDGKRSGDGEAAFSSDGQSATADLSIDVNRPQLWSLESPSLYQLEVAVVHEGDTVDLASTSFGIRSLAWNAQQGFLLNGETVLMRGGCVHHDHGLLGSAVYPAAEERRVRTLKAAGYNAIRCAHNPPSEAFLDACDRLGMLVIDEAFDMWRRPKNPQDYHRFFDEWWQRDVDAMVRRDRNHPSVVMWSIGNEIPERFDPEGVETAHRLADHIREMDSSRPITSAFNSISDKADPFFEALDIAGYNYSPQNYERDHERVPDRVMVATESFARDSFRYWDKVVQLPYVIGDFIWTSWDYLGESGIGHTKQVPAEDNAFLMPWPWHDAYCGDFDICGFQKPQSLYRQVLWGVRPVSILVEQPGPDGKVSEPDLWGWWNEQPSWTWPGREGEEVLVRVYADADEVSLNLNGSEIGRQPAGEKLTTEFKVPYSPGTLVAQVYKDGQPAAEARLATAGKPAALWLTPDHPTLAAARDSVAFVALTLVDDQGQVVPVAANDVTVEVSGSGRLIALGNGDPTDVESLQDSHQKLWHGTGLAVIRSDGTAGPITCKATVEGIPTAQLTLNAVEP